jgi:hypothetical protein
VFVRWIALASQQHLGSQTAQVKMVDSSELLTAASVLLVVAWRPC